MSEKRNGMQELKPKIRPRMEQEIHAEPKPAAEEKPAIAWRE